MRIKLSFLNFNLFSVSLLLRPVFNGRVVVGEVGVHGAAGKCEKYKLRRRRCYTAEYVAVRWQKVELSPFLFCEVNAAECRRISSAGAFLYSK